MSATGASVRTPFWPSASRSPSPCRSEAPNRRDMSAFGAPSTSVTRWPLKLGGGRQIGRHDGRLTAAYGDNQNAALEARLLGRDQLGRELTEHDAGRRVGHRLHHRRAGRCPRSPAGRSTTPSIGAPVRRVSSERSLTVSLRYSIRITSTSAPSRPGHPRQQHDQRDLRRDRRRGWHVGRPDDLDLTLGLGRCRGRELRKLCRDRVRDQRRLIRVRVVGTDCHDSLDIVGRRPHVLGQVLDADHRPPSSLEVDSRSC